MAAKASQETTKSKTGRKPGLRRSNFEDIKTEIRRVKGGKSTILKQQIDALSNSTTDRKGFVGFPIETLLKSQAKMV